MTDIADPPVYLQRIDPRRNMARFYTIAVQPTLFGEMSLVRNWGRIGTSGRSMVQTFDQPDALERARKDIERAKRRRGYAET